MIKPANNYFKVRDLHPVFEPGPTSESLEQKCARIMARPVPRLKDVFPFHDESPYQAWRAALAAAGHDTARIVVWRAVQGRLSGGNWNNCERISESW